MYLIGWSICSCMIYFDERSSNAQSPHSGWGRNSPTRIHECQPRLGSFGIWSTGILRSRILFGVPPSNQCFIPMLPPNTLLYLSRGGSCARFVSRWCAMDFVMDPLSGPPQNRSDSIEHDQSYHDSRPLICFSLR